MAIQHISTPEWKSVCAGQPRGVAPTYRNGRKVEMTTNCATTTSKNVGADLRVRPADPTDPNQQPHNERQKTSTATSIHTTTTSGNVGAAPVPGRSNRF